MDAQRLNIIAIVEEVEDELLSAIQKFPSFRSAHEGYAILKEEVDELWDEVKNNKNDDPRRQRKEAIQVAAMAMRFVLDISDNNNHRNERDCRLLEGVDRTARENRVAETSLNPDFDPDGFPWGTGADIP